MKASCGLSTGETVCWLRAILVHWYPSSRGLFGLNCSCFATITLGPGNSKGHLSSLYKRKWNSWNQVMKIGNLIWSFTCLVNVSCCWYLGVAQSQSIRTSTLHNSIDPFPSPFYLIKPPFFPIYAGCWTPFNLSMCFNNFRWVKGVKWTVS